MEPLVEGRHALEGRCLRLPDGDIVEVLSVEHSYDDGATCRYLTGKHAGELTQRDTYRLLAYTIVDWPPPRRLLLRRVRDLLRLARLEGRVSERDANFNAAGRELADAAALIDTPFGSSPARPRPRRTCSCRSGTSRRGSRTGRRRPARWRS
jgi:hypothetical protein